MLFLNFLSRLPLNALYLLTDVLYVFTYFVWRFRRQLSISNIRNSFPDKSPEEVDRIARRSYHNACDLIAEVIKGATMAKEELRRRVTILNIEALEQFTGAGQSVILLASHHCNWEWLLLECCNELNIGVDAVYKPLRVSAVDRFMLNTRSRFGGNPIPVRDFMREVMKRRGSPRVFAMVADQTPRRRDEKHWTRFLNQDTAFFIGADRIARIARAPVFSVGMRRSSRGHYEARLELLAQPPYSAESDIIERYARAAEARITLHPEDWLWMYRKWKYKKPLYG